MHEPTTDVSHLLTRNVPLREYTYLRIGGPAQFFATPDDRDGVTRLAAWATSEGRSLRVLGGGSNVLVSDDGLSGLAISLRRACAETTFDGVTVSAGAGVMLPALARAAAAHDLGGLEFAIGIPGAVGGALQTNAGIGDGRSIGGLVRSVDVLDGAAVRTLGADELTFDYRTSSLRDSGLVVLAATLELHPRPGSEAEAEMRKLLATRSASQPTAGPNAGSMFRNPPGDYAGRVIEAAGCKGLTSGAASISELHANFIVHDGSASAADIVALMSDVQRRVADQLDVWLVPEVEWWGDGDLPAPWQGAPQH